MARLRYARSFRVVDFLGTRDDDLARGIEVATLDLIVALAGLPQFLAHPLFEEHRKARNHHGDKTDDEAVIDHQLGLLSEREDLMLQEIHRVLRRRRSDRTQQMVEEDCLEQAIAPLNSPRSKSPLSHSNLCELVQRV